MGGVSCIQAFSLDFLNFFNFAKPLMRVFCAVAFEYARVYSCAYKCGND